MSVHRMPPRDEPFDPRQAALSHAGMAGEHATQPGREMFVMGELANAIACGLVYVGDQVTALIDRVDGGQEESEGLGLSYPAAGVDRIQVGMPFEIPATVVGGPTPTDSWREFLREQAAQIPEGIEFALRELLSQLEGQSLEFELREPVQSLTDWLNQLANVRGEVRDGGAGE